MSAALWGFLGTIVGAASVFGATVWQQRVSDKHERERRRRDSQIEILTELLDAISDMLYSTGRGWNDAQSRFRATRLVCSVVDQDLRAECAKAFQDFDAVEEARKTDHFEQRRREATEQISLVSGLIGAQLRALY